MRELTQQVQGFLTVVFLAVSVFYPAQSAELGIELSDAQLGWIGERIYQNECSGRIECLVHWNQGEAFPSLGIGHFIWYPAGIEDRFVESFPGYVRYAVQAGAQAPQWLSDLKPLAAPWPDRQSFILAGNTEDIRQLRTWLNETQGLQVAYILDRARGSLRSVINAAPEREQWIMEQRIKALVATAGGSYALIDYVNFKGEGLSQTETYNGEGWGLLQVMQQMTWHPDKSTLRRFREAAAAVLTRRAANASNAIERERWLPGWLNRLDTYREPENF